MTIELCLVTSNTHKFLKIQTAFAHPLHQIDLDLLEVQTTDVKEVVEHKVKEA